MKKFLLVLGMAACLFGMTACSGEETTAAAGDNAVTAEEAYNFVDMILADMNDMIAAGTQDQYASDKVFTAGITSWEAALDEMGSYVGITSAEGTLDSNALTLTAQIDGSERDAVLTITLDATAGSLESISVDVTKTFGELMTNAALNTLLGMGTVFIVLILLAWLIGLFKYIPVIQEKFSGKKKEEAPKAAPAPVAVAPVVDEVAEEDDLELIAVIAAAIAASEGAASVDGFVVRSVKRRGNKWQKA